MIKIVVGTNSNYKLNAIKKALFELDFEFSINNIEVDSGVAEQPTKPGETILGSINRAKNALSKYPENDIGLGVEFGYEPINESYHMICWASIVTKDNKVFSEHSSSLGLPEMLKVALLNGEEVGDHLERLYDKLEDIERNRIFRQYLTKRRVIYESVTNVALRFLLDKELY
jgi:non-canonical (house-cleaning) NTP pyrophosphatase